MSGLLILAFLVSCSSGLSDCVQLDTSALTFADMGICRAQLVDVVAARQRSAAHGRVVMGKCHYVLRDGPPAPVVAEAHVQPEE
jgi:hypothetical protein